MKPTLLFIKRYIQQEKNYHKIHHEESKNKHSFQYKSNNFSNKNCLLETSQSWLKKTKQVYFTMPKTFNELKSKLRKQILENKNKLVQSSLKQLKQTNQTITKNQDIRKDQGSEQKNHEQIQSKKHKRNVKWDIQQNLMLKSSEIQSFTEINHTQIDEVKKNSLKQIKQNFYNQFPLQSLKNVPKNLLKLGYSTIQNYLQQMNKTNKLKQVKKKMVAYHCIGRKQNDLTQFQIYNKKLKMEKNVLKQKNKKYEQKVQVKQNFSQKYVKLIKDKIKQIKKQLKYNKKQQSYQWKQVNNQSKNKGLKDQKTQYQTIHQMTQSEKFKYQSITIVNCTNRNFLNFPVDQDINFKELFQYCAPFLNKNMETKLKQSDQKEEQQNSCLYFCYLSNYSLSAFQCFFCLGKPIMFYRRQKIIQKIQNFLNQLNAQQLFQSQKVYIVDSRQRTSYVQKSKLNLLLRQSTFKTKQKKNNNFRRSTRLSRSIQYLQQNSNSLILMSLIQGIKQNNSNLNKRKKLKTAIDKKGNFYIQNLQK